MVSYERYGMHVYSCIRLTAALNQHSRSQVLKRYLISKVVKETLSKIFPIGLSWYGDKDDCVYVSLG